MQRLKQNHGSLKLKGENFSWLGVRVQVQVQVGHHASTKRYTGRGYH